MFDDDNEISISSFIPFCEFGDMNGYMNPAFDFPTCKIFNPKIFNNQLCYQVDLNKFKDSFSSDNLKNGITFFVDMNEDRQFSWTNDIQLKNSGIKAMTIFFYISNYLAWKLRKTVDEDTFTIHLGTLGKYNSNSMNYRNSDI